MKVKITHTVDLDTVPVRCSELMTPALEEISKSLSSLKTIQHLLQTSDPDELSLAVQHLELSRRKLAIADTVLSECYEMLSGVDNLNAQEAQKKAMEESLEQQEAEYEQQKVQAETTPPPPREPRVEKRWNPINKSSSIIEDDKTSGGAK